MHLIKQLPLFVRCDVGLVSLNTESCCLPPCNAADNALNSTDLFFFHFSQGVKWHPSTCCSAGDWMQQRWLHPPTKTAVSSAAKLT